MVVNISQFKLATSEAGRSWHPTDNVILLFGNEYSVPRHLELLGKWSNERYPAETKICNLYHLRKTFAITHYLLTRLYFYPNLGQPFIHLKIKEIQNHFTAGNNCYWQFTRLLVSVEENDTNKGLVAVKNVEVKNEELIRLYVKNLESSKDMEELRKMVDQNFNLRVVQCLKGVMDMEARKKLVQDLKAIGGANTALEYWPEFLYIASSCYLLYMYEDALALIMLNHKSER